MICHDTLYDHHNSLHNSYLQQNLSLQEILVISTGDENKQNIGPAHLSMSLQPTHRHPQRIKEGILTVFKAAVAILETYHYATHCPYLGIL